MCGRYTLASDLDGFARKMALKYDPKKHNPRYNIYPTQQVPVVLNDGSKTITTAKWGLIPSWSKDPSIAFKLANARREGIESKPSFREPFKHRRCLALADGFYEWHPVEGSKIKIPFYFRLNSHEVFAFGALWDTWTDPATKKEVVTVCLITTTPNMVVEPVHTRMPVILEPRYYDIWMGGEDQPLERLQRCMQPYPAAQMKGYAVSTLVNKPQNDRPELIQPAGTGGCS